MKRKQSGAKFMEKPGNTWSALDFIRIGYEGMPACSLGGIDVTYRCNLRCRHCYFLQQNYHEELPIDQWLRKFENMKKEGFPFMICGWIGGEPLLRKELIEEGRKYFKANVVFTNGTITFPNWPDVTFSVSVHGTAKYHSLITGVDPDTYRKIKRNVDRDDLDVVIAFCVTRLNYTCIDAMLAEWSRTAVRGIVFEFYTPVKGENRDLWLNWEERDEIIDHLMALRKEYGDFIWISDRIYRLMKSDRAPEITGNCPFPKIGFSFDPMGHPKLPCQLGFLADCSRCGCILPYFSMLLTHQSLLIPEFTVSVAKRGLHAMSDYIHRPLRLHEV
jgi:Fe-coproporphyrin III synthase